MLGASEASRWYERGLLHPLVDFDRVPPHLNSIVDALDPDGTVPLPTLHGLGDDWNLDHVAEHTVEKW